ncbi:hypothetical protein M3Y97_00631200 [Aphelenchoides bicaudatus]|nr:hypothetical protein M3Y97_00631200 [Aphelenchoides bicaudatus]
MQNDNNSITKSENNKQHFCNSFFGLNAKLIVFDKTFSSTEQTMQTVEDGYVSYSLAYIIVGSMMFCVLVVLIMFFVFLCIVRRQAKNECKRELRGYREMLDQIRLQSTNKRAIQSPAYVITPQQKQLKIQQDKLAGPERVEARAAGLAGVVSYLAENPLNLEQNSLKPPNNTVILVPQHLPAMGQGDQRARNINFNG